jgi:hypothetical protein
MVLFWLQLEELSIGFHSCSGKSSDTSENQAAENQLGNGDQPLQDRSIKTIALAVYSGRRRDVPCATLFMIARLYTAAVWATGYRRRYVAVDLATKISCSSSRQSSM